MQMMIPDDLPLTLGDLCVAIDEGRVPFEVRDGSYVLKPSAIRELEQRDRWSILSGDDAIDRYFLDSRRRA